VVEPTSLERGEGLLTGLLPVADWEWRWKGRRWWWWDERRRAKSTVMWLMNNSNSDPSFQDCFRIQPLFGR
jgi:hypothetical protein